MIQPQPPPVRLAQPCGEPLVPQRDQVRVGLAHRARIGGGPVRTDAARAAEHGGAFQKGIAAHQPAHAGPDDGGIIPAGAGAEAGIDPLLEWSGDPVQVGVRHDRTAGHRVHRRAQGAGGGGMDRAGQILAIAIRSRRPDANDDMRFHPPGAHGSQHGLVRRPDLVEVGLGRIEQVVPIVYVQHRIAALAPVVAGREPDRQPLVGQACRRDPLILQQPARVGDRRDCQPHGQQPQQAKGESPDHLPAASRIAAPPPGARRRV